MSRSAAATSLVVVVAVAVVVAVLLVPTVVEAALGNATAAETTTPLPPPLHSPGDAPAMTWQAWYTAAACAAVLLALSLDLAPCSAAMFLCTLSLRLAGIINTDQALAGLANSSVVTVQLLVVLIAPIAQLPALRRIVKRGLSLPRRVSAAVVAGATAPPPPSPTGAAESTPLTLQTHSSGGSGGSGLLSRARFALMWPCFKVCALVMLVSGFVGNVPMTAMMTPLVRQFCVENDLPAGQFLMPINVASLIGGTFTVIGVSTTLILNSMLAQTPTGAMGFFELAKVSFVPGLLSLLYVALAPPLLLPSKRAGLVQHVQQRASAFVAQFVVLASSPLAGRRVLEVASLLPAHLADSTELVHMVSAAGDVMAPPEPHVLVAAGDTLAFTGSVPELQRAAKVLHLEWLPVVEIGIPLSAQQRQQQQQQAAAAVAALHGSFQPSSPAVAGSAAAAAAAAVRATLQLPQVRQRQQQQLRASMRLRRTLTLGMSFNQSLLGDDLAVPPLAGLATRRRWEDAAAGGTAPVANNASIAGSGGDALSGTLSGGGGGGVQAPPRFVELVLSHDCPLIGLTIGSGGARARYGVSVLALRRAGGRANLTQGDGLAMQRAVFAAGDTLLVIGPTAFTQRFRRDFFIVTVLGGDDDGGDDAGDGHGGGGGGGIGAEVEEFILLPAWVPWFIGTTILASGEEVRRSAAAASASSGADVPPNSPSQQQQQQQRPSTSPTHREEGEMVTDRGAGCSRDESARLLSPNNSGSSGGGAVASKRRGHVVEVGGDGDEPGARYVRALRVPWWYQYLSVAIFVAAIATSIAGVYLELCCEVAVVALLLLRLRTLQDAIRSFKIDVYLIMAFSFGIGTAVSVSKLSSVIGHAVVALGLDGWPLLAVISLVSSGLANVISSKACVQVLFPIVYQIYRDNGADPLAGVVVLACSVIVSVVTAYAHATNLIVMGPGGYSSRDFLRFGLPLNVLMCLGFATMASLVYDQW